MESSLWRGKRGGFDLLSTFKWARRSAVTEGRIHAHRWSYVRVTSPFTHLSVNRENVLLKMK